MNAQKIRMPLLPFILDVVATIIRQGKEISALQIRKEKVNLLLFAR